ncbi:hypothetical protein HUJ05_010932 [Dendroctonus ponderosae]|nr:hypothetical protein HUJ05_010932 [Dendroctonus ponderosae]
MRLFCGKWKMNVGSWSEHNHSLGTCSNDAQMSAVAVNKTFCGEKVVTALDAMDTVAMEFVAVVTVSMKTAWKQLQ